MSKEIDSKLKVDSTGLKVDFNWKPFLSIDSFNRGLKGTLTSTASRLFWFETLTSVDHPEVRRPGPQENCILKKL